MELSPAIAWAAEHRLGVLITIRSDGRPQSSDIVYTVSDGAFVISVTAGRAKTANLRRDPRAVLHISDEKAWSYVSLDGTVELSPPTTSPGDATSDALVDYYERVAGGPHPDWDEYRRAMIDERRLIARFTPTGAAGHIRG
ncbi:MAG: PPOX class F420-dependent oxidoreductase [Acidimicrobiaceae bacterium]|nr:PPOX class F420-dependent oxidoreductase [Acidimicrobiaceae bacterium]MCY3643128.1 PPOX class F420-dependent oxidoreductase [Acidimicrobiaceae bacterium]MDE0666201.1 PPOX class F420-dependent oxidoreductase [Acidimicrobiaceae bacterium]MXW88388.1 PPOX class F420-dependent oxidoreductase [Acidimicrobiaceae bacterium]MYE57830.1 PPOX class F420-dependent oxidoreductase [Acidimicrobiaceae bacterium]